MKKNIKLVSILLLTLLMVASLVVVAACNDDPVTVTMTVDYGIDGMDNATVTVEVGEQIYFKLTPPTTDYTFGGWYLNGAEVTTSTLAPNTDFTVKARWSATYRVQYWLEKLDVAGEYQEATEYRFDGYDTLGATISAEVRTINGFTYDETNANNVTSATLADNGTTLKLYYNRNSLTITFDKLIDSAVGTMTTQSGRYGSTVTLTANSFTSDYEFVGWNTAADGTGTAIADCGAITLNGNVTLYAQWQTTYTVAIYTEKDVDDVTKTDGAEYVLSTETPGGIIGHTVSVAVENPNSAKYALSATASVTSGVVSEQGLELEVYFNLRTFTIRYMDDNTTVTVKYGESHTVRTPANSDPNYYVRSYSTSMTGNGRDYQFDSTIENIISDYTLYPVIIDVYYDEAGSSDRVEIRRNMSGYGSAVLVIDGVRHEGWAITDNGYLEFEVEIDGDVIYGMPYVDDDDNTNWFMYRGEEAGVYFFYDYIFGGEYVYDNIMLALDGYGTGVLSMYASDGTNRTVNYYVMYMLYDESVNEYYMLYYLPTDTSKIYEDYFRIVKQTFVIADDYGTYLIDGYFMLWNYDGECDVALMCESDYLLLDNNELYAIYLYLDGYGNAMVYTLNSEGNINAAVTGIYYGSQDYYDHMDDPSYQEYWFSSNNENAFPSCYFIVTYVTYNNSYLPVFLTKNAEYGLYTVEGANYPELYLDGYGGALYVTGAYDSGRYGSYTINVKDAEQGIYTVIITFADEIGGTLVADITIDEQIDGYSYGTFTINDTGFLIDADGTLYGYTGNASVIVIPEGVKRIDAQVFSDIHDIYVTSVTFPTTLEEIGDYAFSNGSISGGTSLTTVIFLGSTPPTLGLDVFRWVMGANFRIIVPDGAKEAYTSDPSWTKDEKSMPGGYAQFVTTQYDIDNKPEFEVVNGVLISYNNKETNPTEVDIVIPSGVNEIAYGVFAGLTYISTVDLNEVTVIGANAFYGCYYITQVTFNPNTVSIGTRAFYECINIREVNLGEIQSIGAEAFSRCWSLSKVTIGASITYIGDQAFYECSRDVSYVENPDGGLDEIVEQYDIIVEIAATTAPTMGKYIFQGSQPRIYVDSYETAIVYAGENSWSTYISYVRIHTDEAQVWYSKSNENGWILELGDRLVFDDNYLGWYKWTDSTTLAVTWLTYTEIANTVSLQTQTATLNAQGELVGLNLYWDEGVAYTFVKAGTTLTYTSDSGETLEITLGTGSGVFQGDEVEIVMNGYRMQFTHDGYLYTVTLMANSNTLTFSYTATKITVITEYQAADGSTIEVRDGQSIYIYGTLMDVDNHTFTTEVGWYAFRLGDNAYWFTKDWLSTRYYIAVYVNKTNNTFTYEWSLYSTYVTYTASNGDRAIVTVSNGEVTSIHILFKTSNGTEEQVAQIISGSDGTYTIVIDGTVEIEDEDGGTHTENSTFNGTYTLTFHDDATNPTFELVQIA